MLWIVLWLRVVGLRYLLVLLPSLDGGKRTGHWRLIHQQQVLTGNLLLLLVLRQVRLLLLHELRNVVRL